MLLDNNLLFSDAQAITAAAGSTNIIDTAPLFTGNLGRNVGVGAQAIYVFWGVDVAFTDAGSDSTLAVTLETDDNTGMTTATTVATFVTLAALSPVGTRGIAVLPPFAYERYIGLRYTPSSDLTTGSITAGLTLDADQWRAYAPGATTGVE